MNNSKLTMPVNSSFLEHTTKIKSRIIKTKERIIFQIHNGKQTLNLGCR